MAILRSPSTSTAEAQPEMSRHMKPSKVGLPWVVQFTKCVTESDHSWVKRSQVSKVNSHGTLSRQTWTIMKITVRLLLSHLSFIRSLSIAGTQINSKNRRPSYHISEHSHFGLYPTVTQDFSDSRQNWNPGPSIAWYIMDSKKFGPLLSFKGLLCNLKKKQLASGEGLLSGYVTHY